MQADLYPGLLFHVNHIGEEVICGRCLLCGYYMNLDWFPTHIRNQHIERRKTSGDTRRFEIREEAT